MVNGLLDQVNGSVGSNGSGRVEPTDPARALRLRGQSPTNVTMMLANTHVCSYRACGSHVPAVYSARACVARAWKPPLVATRLAAYGGEPLVDLLVLTILTTLRY